MTTPPLINADARMLDCALFYAKHYRWAVFPVHVPIHNDAGECVGCTCEHYRRSEENRQRLIAKGRGREYDEHYKCQQPGKCPAVKWRDKSTIDEAQIRKWWSRPWTAGDVRYFPNLSLDCGKSGVLVHDGDIYKPDYGGADYLNMSDRQTVTAQTGRGGEHLFYQSESQPYSNANGALPYGNDIRGNGGYVVLTPSLHATGQRCQWETGYGPHEINLAPIPEALGTLLDRSNSKTASAIAVTFGAVSLDAPDLKSWDLSEFTVNMIQTPAERGHRSEHDAHVVTALCAAGATDDDILAIFSHYPIGTAGKYAERGADYLARTLTNCRAHLAKQEAERRRTMTTVATLRLWGQTHSFAELIPGELRGQHYRSDSTDTKVFDAICDCFEKTGQLRAQLGKKRLAKDAGLGSCNTAVKALARLSAIFSVTTEGHGLIVELREEFRRAYIDPLLSPIECEGGINLRATNFYSPRKAADPFLVGSSRTVKERCRQAAAVAGGTFKEWLATVPKGLGETSLRILDTLGRCGEMTKADLAGETGKPLASIGRTCVRLEACGLVESERDGPRAAKVYSLALEVWRKAEALAPSLRTYNLSAEREAKRLKEAQRWATTEQMAAITAGDEAEHNRLERRLAKLGNQRLKVLGHIYPEMASADLSTLAFDVLLPTAPHPALIAKMKRLHANARIDRAEQRRRNEWALNGQAQQLRNAGAGKHESARQLMIAGFTPSEAWAAVKRVWPNVQSIATTGLNHA